MSKLSVFIARVLVLFCCVASFAWSSTTVVTSNADSGTNTLRDAIANANAGDTIQFALPGATITLASTLTLTKNVTIDGSGNTGLTISGNHAVEVFVVNAGITATIASLTIADGSSGTGGGGIYNLGTLTVANCTLMGNSGHDGGGIYNDGTTLTVTNSTLSGNSVGYLGGGIYQHGGTATITNNTFVNNSANYGGGIFSNTGSASAVTNNLFLGNNVPYFGGSIDDGGATINANYNLYWNNADTSGAQGINCNGCASNTNAVNADPVLGLLQYNGGPTPTYLPGVASAAIDAGTSSGCPATDQRGSARPQPVGGACDIGSVEVLPVPYTPVSTTGYNLDGVAESYPAAGSTTGTLDGGYVVYSAAYGLDPNIHTGRGLPDDGQITNGSRTYQLQPYTGNNALVLYSGGSGTLTLTTPRQYASLSLLGFATNGTTNADFVVHFSDSTAATFTGIFVPDWFDGGSNVVIAGFDRVFRSTDAADGYSVWPYLYAFDNDLACADQAKFVTSIDLTNTGLGAELDIFAASAVATLQPITGSGIISVVGRTTTLSDTTPGGVWSTDNPGVATVDSASGVVTGHAQGGATITYTLTLSPCSAIVTQSKLVLVADEIFMDGFE